MPSIALDDTPFAGTTSRPASSSTVSTSCTGCGSSLAGRKQRSRRATVGRARYLVHTWGCGCGKRRTIRQEVAGQ
jgi:hypothetical protein